LQSSGAGAGSGAASGQRKSRDVMDLEKYVDKRIRVKFAGGREGTSVTPKSNTEISGGSAKRRPQRTRAASQPAASLTQHCALCLLSLPAVVGVLKGFDQLANVVLDETQELLSPAPDVTPSPAEGGAPATRHLGLIVCRGPTITVVCPEDGLSEIANPFLAAEGE
jgi:U6 snRNA-associated Sm-like protein LSm7